MVKILGSKIYAVVSFISPICKVTLKSVIQYLIWNKVFKSGTSKICGIQLLKKLK